jgi:hypothetical protein
MPAFLQAISSSKSVNGPPLWSSGQSSWLQIRRSGFDYRRYQIFREVVGLERVPLRLVSTIEELLKINSSGFADYATSFYSEKLALTSSTRSGGSVGIVCSRTQATGLVFVLLRTSASSMRDIKCSSKNRRAILLPQTTAVNSPSRLQQLRV